MDRAEADVQLSKRLDDIESKVGSITRYYANTRQAQQQIFDRLGEVNKQVREWEAKFANMGGLLFGQWLQQLEDKLRVFDERQYSWHTTVDGNFRGLSDSLAREVQRISYNARCATEESRQFVHAQVAELRMFNETVSARIARLTEDCENRMEGLENKVEEAQAMLQAAASRHRYEQRCEARSAPSPFVSEALQTLRRQVRRARSCSYSCAARSRSHSEDCLRRARSAANDATSRASATAQEVTSSTRAAHQHLEREVQSLGLQVGAMRRLVTTRGRTPRAE